MFVVVLADKVRSVYRPGVPNLLFIMYPFSIPTDEHVPLQHFKRQACTPSAFRQVNMYP